jgi:tetratricopeptide (TPR) repeat protein
MSLYYQGRLDSAARGFRGTLTADSSFWGSYYYLGLINKDLGFYKTAINRFAKAIKLPVKNAALRSNIYLSMGECWELLGELPDAKMHYRAAINLNLESSPAKAGYKRVIQLIAQK